MKTRPAHATPLDRGQATVELALALPLVCVFLLAVVQVAAVVADQMSVVAAAREGARAAAVAADPASAARAAAERATSLRPLEIDTAIDDATVTVTVESVNRTGVALIGAAIPDVALRARVTMVLEPP